MYSPRMQAYHMGSDMVRTTNGTLHGISLHCLRAGGNEKFCLGLRLEHAGATEAYGRQIGKILPVQKFGQLDRTGHWTMATTSGFSAYRSNFYGFTLSNAPVPKVGPSTGARAKIKHSKKNSHLRCQAQCWVDLAKQISWV